MKNFIFLFTFIIIYLLNSFIYSESLPVLIIDPGHGGNDKGIEGINEICEKDITLFVAKKIDENLNDRYKVILTRTNDYYINIMDRHSIANENDGDIFISIHAGASRNTIHHGCSIFYWHDFNIENIFSNDHSIIKKDREQLDWFDQQMIHVEFSKIFAEILYKNFINNQFILDSRVQRGPFLILSGVDMPSILIEIGFLAHPSEIKKIKKSNFTNRLSEQIHTSINGLIQKKEKDALRDLHYNLERDTKEN